MSGHSTLFEGQGTMMKYCCTILDWLKLPPFLVIALAIRQLRAVRLRPVDIQMGRANPSKARAALGWVRGVDVSGVIARMCAAV